MTNKQRLASLSKKMGVWAAILFLLLAGGGIWASSASAAVVPSATHHPSETPVGVTWNLTVQFLSGSRQGQTESSVMTFLPDGQLTATFPNSTQPPVIDGWWHMTSPDAFHYSFKDELAGVFVQTQIDAYVTSPTTYVAGGVGVVYATTTNQPVGYNVTQTSAVAS